MKEEHEYKVTIDYPEGDCSTSSGLIHDPRVAGEKFRESREKMRTYGSGGTVTLNRRPVGPWEVVEKAEVKGGVE